MLLLVFVVAALLGCGDGNGYRVSGKATFEGKPIPVGRIYFTPDAAQQNTGAAGYAAIKDGAYDTSAEGGMGVVAGPMIVKIEGSDGVRTDDEHPFGNQLFYPYETKANLPKSSSTKDFDVPASAVNPPPPPRQEVVP
jgi:hypothetical protein